MKKTKLFATIGMTILSSALLIGCDSLGKKEETTSELSYSDLVNESINNNQDDTYLGSNANTSGEYVSSTTDDGAIGTLDYGSLTDEEIAEILNKRNEEVAEEKGGFAEFNNAQDMVQSTEMGKIKDEDLKLYVSYLLLNVFSDDYVVDTTLETTQIKEALGIEEDKYTAAFVQSKSDDNSSFFGLFKVSSKDQSQYLINHLLNYSNSFENDELMANSIIAEKKGKDSNGDEMYIVLFVSFDLSNREEPLEIPEGYALIEEFEDGSYVLEGEDMYGNVIQFNGKRITMNTNYREMIVGKLKTNYYEIIK